MSQVDFIIYLPVLLWFIIIAVILYFNIVTWVFSSIYYVIKSRKILYKNLISFTYFMLFVLRLWQCYAIMYLTKNVQRFKMFLHLKSSTLIMKLKNWKKEGK